MNIIRKTIAAASGVVLSLGFALPVAALNVDGSVNSATEGTVNVGGTGASGTAQANVGVDVGIGTESSGTTSGSGGSAQGSGSADADATMEANAGVSIQPLIITRAHVDGGAVTATVSSPSAVKTQADLSGYIAAEMKADKNISSVESASGEVAVTYKQPAKLFGFIPVTIAATATVDASGNVEVSYPWYAFLMVTNESDLEARIQDSVDATLGANAQLGAGAALNASAGKDGIVSANASATSTAQANANADANATAEATAQLSAETQAKVVAAVKAAMQAELNADLNASVGGTVSVQ